MSINEQTTPKRASKTKHKKLNNNLIRIIFLNMKTVQWEPENSGIESQHLNSIYDFK